MRGFSQQHTRTIQDAQIWVQSNNPLRRILGRVQAHKVASESLGFFKHLPEAGDVIIVALGKGMIFDLRVVKRVFSHVTGTAHFYTVLDDRKDEKRLHSSTGIKL